jgi:magnesium-transporting ATPase (P-type)
MGQRNALIRRLPAVETLGSATIICSDKTGTLTKGEMTVVKIFCGKKTYTVSGSGYNPEGEFFLGDKKADVRSEGELTQILRTGLLCNSAAIEATGEGYNLSGDPTEGALIVAAHKAGLDADSNRLDEIPFDSQSRYMVTLNREKDRNVIHIKGSPEKILDICDKQLVNGSFEPIDLESSSSQMSNMTKKALRVLGLAYKEVPSNKMSLAEDDLKGFVFLGFQGMIDPPREEAIEAIEKCKKAGIRVIMVTGDHPQTAEAIAKQLGIDAGGGVITGEDLTKITDEDLFNTVEKVSIFARVAPSHKFRVATQLQKRGHIVAVTGDGVNDAPALKAADLGVAMGIKGTDVAKEASDIVSIDDNFATIVAAVEEGRFTFENIRKVILYTLPTNGGQAFDIADEIVHAQYRNSFARSELVKPGEIVEFIIHLGHVSQLFQVGHRIRIDITSSNFHTFDRNMNTGNEIGEDAKGIPASQTIYLQSGYAYYVGFIGYSYKIKIREEDERNQILQVFPYRTGIKNKPKIDMPDPGAAENIEFYEKPTDEEDIT